jgi:Putative auto-transporter adhesin, head GIN domain
MKTPSILLATALAALTLSSGCTRVFCHKPKGPDVSQTFDLPEITGFELHIAADVTVRKGSAQAITVTGPQNFIDLLDIDVDGGIWQIKDDGCTCGRKRLSIDITLTDFSYASIAGSGDVKGDSVLSGLDDVELNIAGSGDMQLDLEANSLATRISGSGDINVDGSATVTSHDIAGSGKILASDLLSEDCNAEISGSGEIRVNASKTLDARISGSGDVYYKGTPAVTTHISGSGNVIHEE